MTAVGRSAAKKSPVGLVSQRAYAKQRGCSQQAVNWHTVAHGGPIPTYGPEKLIDPAEADRLWPQRTNGPRRGQALDFDRARTRKMVAEAARAQLELEARRGALVDRVAGERIVFAFGRRHRDAWLAWPARIGAEFAAALGVEAAAVIVQLEAYVAHHLEELSGERFDLAVAGASVVGDAAGEPAA